MDLKLGDIVSLVHYSQSIPFQSIVLGVFDNEVLLKLDKTFSIYNLFENDPVVMGYKTGFDIYVAECSIRLINTKDSSVALKIENIEHIKEKRIFERFPVSLYADMKLQDGIREMAYVRNISLDGLYIVSKKELSEGDNLILDTYIDNRTLTLAGAVMWKDKSSRNFQYGIKTIYHDFTTKNSLKVYLGILKDEQENAVMKLK